MNRRILVTILMVTYNAEKTLEKAISSVIMQKYKPLEFIVIDGASNDGTLKILEKYSSNISFMKSEPDNGIYEALNKGLDYATGDFLIVMGADDTFYSVDSISNIVSNIVKLDDVYYGNVIMWPSGRIHWGKFCKIKLGIGNICHQAIFYPRCLYKKYKYDTNYKLFADYVMNIKLYHLYNFCYVNEIVSIYNSEGFSSTKKDSKFEKDKNVLIYKYLGLFPLIARYVYFFLLYVRDFCQSTRKKQKNV